MKQITKTALLVLLLLSILRSSYCNEDTDEYYKKKENYEDREDYEDIEVKYVYFKQTVNLPTTLMDLQKTTITDTTTVTVPTTLIDTTTVPTTLTDTTTATVPTTLTDTTILTVPVPITITTTLTTTFTQPTCAPNGAPCNLDNPGLCCSQACEQISGSPAFCISL